MSETTSMSSKIQTHRGQKTIDRSTEPLPKSWVWPQDTIAIHEAERCTQVLLQYISNTEQVACLMMKKLENTQIISVLHSLSQKGKRVYLLVEQYTAALNQLKGHCLIRVFPSGECSCDNLLLIDPNSNNSQAYMLSGNIDTTIGLGLLCQVQSDKLKPLFRYYCYFFWERAIEEYLSLEHNHGQKIRGKGVDVYFDVKQLSQTYLYDLLLHPVEGESRANHLDRYLSLDQTGERFRIERSGILELPHIQLANLPTRMQLEAAEPKSFEDDLRYLSISYHWQTDPLYLPQGALKDNLYESWIKYGRVKKKELETLREEIDKKLQEIDSDHNTEIDIVQFYNSFGSELRGILSSLNQLVDFNWGKSGDTFEKIKVADELNIKYQHACQKLDEQIKRYKREQRCEKLQKTIRTIQTQRELDRGGLMRMEQLARETQDVEAYKIYQAKTEELQLAQHKSQKELEGLTEELLFLQQELLQENMDPTSSELDVLGASKESDATGRSTMPNLELLPLVGTLYQTDGKLYLAIDDWKDHHIALNEAIRLGATLCAYP